MRVSHDGMRAAHDGVLYRAVEMSGLGEEACLECGLRGFLGRCCAGGPTAAGCCEMPSRPLHPADVIIWKEVRDAGYIVS